MRHRRRLIHEFRRLRQRIKSKGQRKTKSHHRLRCSQSALRTDGSCPAVRTAERSDSRGGGDSRTEGISHGTQVEKTAGWERLLRHAGRRRSRNVDCPKSGNRFNGVEKIGNLHENLPLSMRCFVDRTVNELDDASEYPSKNNVSVYSAALFLNGIGESEEELYDADVNTHIVTEKAVNA